MDSALVDRLKTDPLAADLRISFVAAALSSYRRDTVLRPFPSMLVTENNKDYVQLDHLLSSLDPLHQLIQAEQVSTPTQELLNWIIDDEISVKTCKNRILKDLTSDTTLAPPPNNVFEIIRNTESERKFQEAKEIHGSFYAYHGTRVENFHSILHYGLNAHLNKTSLFGEGTYLTSDLRVALTFCPSGAAWKQSMLGNKLGCVAVCEVVDHPSVKCQEKHPAVTGSSRARVRGSLGGEVPEKYYVVQNNELVSVKYILVYSDKSKPSPRSSWWFQNRFALLMLSYLVLLLSVGLFGNKGVAKSISNLWR